VKVKVMLGVMSCAGERDRGRESVMLAVMSCAGETDRGRGRESVMSKSK
jgi:hypothetical protein